MPGRPPLRSEGGGDTLDRRPRCPHEIGARCVDHETLTLRVESPDQVEGVKTQSRRPVTYDRRVDSDG